MKFTSLSSECCVRCTVVHFNNNCLLFTLKRSLSRNTAVEKVENKQNKQILNSLKRCGYMYTRFESVERWHKLTPPRTTLAPSRFTSPHPMTKGGGGAHGCTSAVCCWICDPRFVIKLMMPTNENTIDVDLFIQFRHQLRLSV